MQLAATCVELVGYYVKKNESKEGQAPGDLVLIYDIQNKKKRWGNARHKSGDIWITLGPAL